jgi:hypothetical protein
MSSSDVVVNPATHTVYLSATDTTHSTNSVTVIDATTLQQVTSFQYHQSGEPGALLWDPYTMAIDPVVGGNLYVTDIGGGSLFTVATATCSATTHTACNATYLPLGPNLVPLSVVVDPVSHRVLTTAEDASGKDPYVLVLTSAGAFVANVSVQEFLLDSGVGPFQINAALSPSGKELLVTGQTNGKHPPGIVVVPLATLAISANATVDSNCGTSAAVCGVAFMGSDPSQGNVLVLDNDNFNNPATVLAQVPLDVPPGLGGLSPQNPSTQPYVTAVGGTTLTALGPAPTETTWNNRFDPHGQDAGTGGVSQLWPKPAWQTGPGVVSGASSGTPCGAAPGSYCRQVPDVAADADGKTGYVVYSGGAWKVVGGTSAATPTVAAVVALLEAHSSPARRLGLLNPTLYSLAAGGHVVNDVTSGTIDFLGTGGGRYAATAAYDMATGLGTPIATAWADAIVPNAPFLSWSAFVQRQFVDLTAKAPSSAQLTNWIGLLNGGSKTKGDLIEGLRRGPDNTTNVDPTARLYRAFLGRTPDAGGLKFWVNRHRTGGWTLTRIADYFASSSEFIRKYGALTNRQFVTRIYTDVLGRTADTAGVNYWTAKLDTKVKTRGQVMVGFSESSEYKRKQAENTDAAVAYIYLLGRAPTAGEVTDWVTRQKAGTSQSALATELLESAAYTQHIVG